MQITLTPAAAAFVAGLTPKNRKKVDSLVRLVTEAGMITNPEKFKRLLPQHPRLWELKAHQVRLVGGMVGDRLVIVLGVIKKADHHRPADLDRAERLLDLYLNAGR